VKLLDHHRQAPRELPLTEVAFMKAYVMTTGLVFGLLTLIHVWRVIAEGPHLVSDPWWILITAVAAALCLWAFRLLWLARDRRS
jgi:hypothetical protein